MDDISDTYRMILEANNLPPMSSEEVKHHLDQIAQRQAQDLLLELCDDTEH